MVKKKKLASFPQSLKVCPFVYPISYGNLSTLTLLYYILSNSHFAKDHFYLRAYVKMNNLFSL